MYQVGQFSALGAGPVKRLAKALRGRTAFKVWLLTEVRSYNPEFPEWKVWGPCEVFAQSAVAAVGLAMRFNPCSRFGGIKRSGRFVGIEEAVAYPCRLARRILKDFRGSDELENLGGVLGLAQLRQDMVREPDPLEFPWLMPDHANDPADGAAPKETGAKHGLGERDELKVGNGAVHARQEKERSEPCQPPNKPAIEP